jgi:hypothetical protein
MAVNDEIERLNALVAWARANGVLSLSTPDGMSVTLDPDWRPQASEPTNPDELVDDGLPTPRRETPEQRAEREQREYDEVLFHSAS